MVKTIRVRIGAALAGMSLVALAGCGGESDGADLPAADASPSNAASSTAPDLPEGVPSEVPERPNDDRSVAGAKAFHRYLVDMWWYTFTTTDTAAMEQLKQENGGNCQWCDEMISQAKRHQKTGFVLRPAGDLGVREEVAAAVSKTEYTAVSEVRIPKIDYVDRKTGERDHSNKQGDWLPNRSNLTWREGAWVLDSFNWEDE